MANSTDAAHVRDQVHTDICLAFATVEAPKAGYEAMFVTDAVGVAEAEKLAAATQGGR